MNCYTHTQKEALGICKHCQKGICMECLVDSGDGLSCKGKCLEEVKLLKKLRDFEQKVVKNNSSQWTSSGLLYLFMGILIIVVPIVFLRKINIVFMPVGLLFLIYGIFVLMKRKAYKENSSDF